MTDLIIIGAGPAGISSALYAVRAGISALIIGKLTSTSLNKAEKIENYYGIESISGKDLYDLGIAQARRVGASIVDEEVVSVEMIAVGYRVVTTKGSYESKALIIASGAMRKLPKIQGLNDFEGRGVSYCAVCDGFFFKKKVVAVLGSQSYALHEAEYLSNLASKVYMLSNGKSCDLTLPENIELLEDKITSVGGDDSINSVHFENGTTLNIDGLFIANDSASANDIARKLGIVTENNKIVVDDKMQTNLTGVFAAGDCVKGLAQVAKAVYEGAVAGTNAVKYVKSLPKQG